MANRILIEEAKEILRCFFEGDWVVVNDNIEVTEIRMGGRIYRLFLVGQTKSYLIESARGHIYAPIRNHPRIEEVRPGDIIFSYQTNRIKSINIALESAEKTYGTDDGRRVDCYYGILNQPLDITSMRSRLAGLKPFNFQGKLPWSGYIHRLHAHAARMMLDEMKKEGIFPCK